MASHRTLPVIAERFTIGRVMVQSWRVFVANIWWFLPIAFIVSGAVIVHAEFADVDAISSLWSFALVFWVSFAIQSLAIAPIVLRVLNPGEARLRTMLQLHFWIRTLKIVIATCMLQVAVYWPIVAKIVLPVASSFPLIWYGLFAANLVAVGTVFSLFYVVILAEQCFRSNAKVLIRNTSQ